MKQFDIALFESSGYKFSFDKNN